ncbi:MAG TPA: TetR/AcrR family transcriptional regulator [Candidatus Binatia bacterium]|jgi:AcrR family transcriptional regulator|nr:TetR/AcrR family transcriptional regulator [Candidatus Binatia bacterium]
MSLKALQSENTKTQLIKVARELFTELGYAATPTEELVRRAGMTRGALYHQYRDKQDLFRAVFETVERELNDKVTQAALAQAEPIERLKAGFHAFLDACLQPDVQRIVILDGPSVLGLQTWREIDDGYSLRGVRAGLDGLIASGHLEAQPVEALAHLLVGALNQAAVAMAVATDEPAARREFGAALDRLLDGLLKRDAPESATRRAARRRPRAAGRRT